MKNIARYSTRSRVYDHRIVRVRDEPLRDLAVRLIVRKRRFSCRPCRRPFTEPVPGIRKGSRSTERHQRGLLWACENFSDLENVRRAYRCSSGYSYEALYAQLEHRRRRLLYPAEPGEMLPHLRESPAAAQQLGVTFRDPTSREIAVASVRRAIDSLMIPSCRMRERKTGGPASPTPP